MRGEHASRETSGLGEWSLPERDRNALPGERPKRFRHCATAFPKPDQGRVPLYRALIPPHLPTLLMLHLPMQPVRYVRREPFEARMTERLRGRRAVEQRKRRLQAEPLCRHCKERGIVRVATVPDHIQPLALGGTDEEDNIQCLCEECHADKTAMEAASQQGASNHPDWLRKAAIPLTIVSGPPASGKTTYIAERAKPDDIVIDLDGIMMRLQPGYQHWSGALNSSLLNRAIRVRNEMLGSLSRRRHGQAWFIVSAPTEAERQWWHGKLGGELVLLDPGEAECKRRALSRGTPKAVEGVEVWFKASRSPWSAPQRKIKPDIGLDGWPVHQ